jgi:hypothetical protein
MRVARQRLSHKYGFISDVAATLRRHVTNRRSRSRRRGYVSPVTNGSRSIGYVAQ